MQTSVTILVVDDSPFAARALVHVLESRGLRARAASTMEEALRICMECRPGVLVTDVCMPNIEIIDLCRHFRVFAPEHRGAVMLFSAHAEETVADVIAAAGADVFMEKSRGAAAVATRVEELCAEVARRQSRQPLPPAPG
jgi:sigma-B regulation protein RsbU (phosphoserine phosphatase)